MVSWRAILVILQGVVTTLCHLLLVPAIYAWISHQPYGMIFWLTALFGYMVAGLMRKLVKPVDQKRLRVQELFLSTTLSWLTATALGAIPFLLILPSISITDAWFETLSGLTTTGASIFPELSQIPSVLLLWRSLLQWLGGLGFMLMTVAWVTVLDVSSLRLLPREAAEWFEKTAPRMKSVARQILSLYAVLTLLCCLGFYVTGLSLFDASNHALTTVSTGGFSTVNDPLVLWSAAAQWNAILFMLLSALPLLLLVQVVFNRHWQLLWQDQQVRGLLILLGILVLLFSGGSMFSSPQPLTETFREICFTLVNGLSTTGYSSDSLSWGGSIGIWLLIGLGMLGGCSGSTVGGIKLLRVQICLEVLASQIKQLIHHNAIAIAYYNGQPVTDAVMRSLIAFLTVFLGSWLLVTVLLLFSGVAGGTAASAALAATSNLGVAVDPVLGTGSHFADFSNSAKWAFSLGMLGGRLEFMTLLVPFFPAFWEK